MIADIDFSKVRQALKEVSDSEIRPKLGALSHSEISEKSAGDFVTSADLAVENAWVRDCVIFYHLPKF